VISLVSIDIGPNPLAVVLPRLHFPDFITIDSPVTFTPSLRSSPLRVAVGQLTIDLTTAVVWQPVPAWHNRLDLELIGTIVSNHPDFRPAVPLDLAGQMQQALCSHDQDRIAQTAGQLAGLGPGLTPAGDDFLVGVLYAVIRNRYSVIRYPITDYRLPITDYCSLITTAAVPRTTRLSANLLEAAGRGEASEAWHELLAVQTSGVFDAYYSAISRILRTGHSSGSDALLGFLMALKSGFPFSRE
jgi:hypothetical protein